MPGQARADPVRAALALQILDRRARGLAVAWSDLGVDVDDPEVAVHHDAVLLCGARRRWLAGKSGRACWRPSRGW
jgi:hypothetical protein